MKKIILIIKQYYMYLLCLLAVLIIVAISYFLIESNRTLIKIEKEVPILNEETELETVNVDIKGAVVNPGVYKLEDSSRVIDVILTAGGLVEQANTALLNLSKKIFDEMVIIIYTNEEIENYNAGKIKTEYVYIEVNNCPDKINNACINETNSNISIDETNEGKEVSGETKENTVISLNTATSEKLQTLTGIGLSKAEAIIKYRKEVGNFNSIDDIKNVTGIGEAIFEKIKTQITI